MKKLLLVFFWLIRIYSGSTGRLTFRSAEKPIFYCDGRWVRFIDIDDKRPVYLSAGTAMMIREVEE